MTLHLLLLFFPISRLTKSDLVVFFCLACMYSHNVVINLFSELSEPERTSVLHSKCCGSLVHLCNWHCGLEQATHSSDVHKVIFVYLSFNWRQLKSCLHTCFQTLLFYYGPVIMSHMITMIMSLLFDCDCTLKCIQMEKVNKFHCHAEIWFYIRKIIMHRN